MDVRVSFSQWLKQQRKQRDLTQEALAERIGCSYIAIHKIEAGARRPSRQIAALLADLFNVPAAEREAFIAFARGVATQVPPPEPASGQQAGPASAQDRVAPRRVRGNLPAPLTRLIGRDAVLTTLRDLLAQEAVRLLTLTGPPGIGKTRLALQAAASLPGDPALPRAGPGAAPVGPAEVWFVELAALVEPKLLLSTIAATLGVKEAAGRPLIDTLTQFLRGTRLLVLDNFEQVIDAAPGVVDLLGACPALKVLVTSREALGVSGEQRFPVPALETADPARLPDQHALADVPAVALFIARARAVQPDFALTAHNAEAVASICARLQGIPLAIELAAARTNVLSPQEMQARLDNSLSLLESAALHVPAKQRTMRGAIDWSYALLSAAEQMLFARLGVFVGGFTLAAAEAVCNARGDLPGDVLDAIGSLLDKSLLRREDGPGASRYTLLEMIRAYALAQLVQRGEADSIRRLHAEYYLALLQGAEAGFSGPEQPRLLARLEAEHDNLRAVLAWVLDHREAGLALRFAGLLSSFWSACGYFTEGRAWLGRAIALAEPGTASPELAHALYGYGLLALQQSDHAAAQAKLEQSRALYRRLDDKEGQCNVLNSLAFLTAFSDYERAVDLNLENLALSRQIGDKGRIARTLQNLGYIKMYQGRWDEASSLSGEAYALARELGSPILPQTLHTLAMVASGQGDYLLAQARFAECLAVSREIRNDSLTAWTLHDLGDLLYRREEYDEARALLTQAGQMFTDLGAQLGTAHTLVSLGREAYRIGDYGAAIQRYTQAVALGRALGNPVVLGCCLAGFAAIAAQEGRLQVAALLFGAAHNALHAASVDLDRYAMTLNMAEVHAAHDSAAPGAWDAAWQEARVLPIEEALAHAGV